MSELCGALLADGAGVSVWGLAFGLQICWTIATDETPLASGPKGLSKVWSAFAKPDLGRGSDTKPSINLKTFGQCRRHLRLLQHANSALVCRGTF